MARLVAVANGNFTSSSSWAACSSAAELDAETAAEALTTGNKDSSTFVLAATAVDAVLVKLGARAAGSPSNTITVTLRNSTAGSDALSLTVNVSDLDPCDSTNKEGGWYCFKFGSTHTPNGTDSYLIRVTLSATTTAVSLWRDGTTSNWARQVRTTTTQAPAAGDRMIVVRELTGAGAGTNRTITMDNTASTNFGSATGLSTSRGNFVNAALAVCKGGTVTWGTSAATAYFLKLTGHIVVYSSGTYTQGGVGTEIPRDSSAIVEFAQTTSQDSRIGVMPGSTFRANGLSRTSGKNIYFTTLAANAAAAATSLTVADDTGWKSGDEVAIAATSRTASECEERTLSGDASSGSFSMSSGLTNAHGGVNDVVAEIALLTRNVQFRSDNSARFSAFEIIGQSSSAGATFTFQMAWAGCRYFGGSGGPSLAICPSGQSLGASSVVDVQFCSFRDYSGNGQACIGNTSSAGGATVTLDSNVIVGIGSGAGLAMTISATSNTNWTMRSNIIIAPLGSGISLSDVQGAAASGNHIVCSSTMLSVSESTTQMTPGLIDNCNIHSGGGTPLSMTCNVYYQTITGVKVWRCNNPSVVNSGVFFSQVTWLNCLFFGNATANLSLIGCMSGPQIFDTCTFAGDTSFATATGVQVAGPSAGISRIFFRGCTFGAGSGTKTTHSTTDLAWTNCNTSICEVIALGTAFNSSTKSTFTGSTPIPGNFFATTNDTGGGAIHVKKWNGLGTVAYETSTTHTSGFAEKLTPNITITGGSLRSSPKRVAVNSGDTVSVSVFVEKDGSYNGATAPRVIVLANPALGITSDTVLDTMTGGSGSFEELTGTTSAVSAAGVLEFCIETFGTAGNAYVAEWAMS